MYALHSSTCLTPTVFPSIHFNMQAFTVFKGSPNGEVVESRIQHPDPQENEVLVQITHSGLCGTDEHYKCADIVLGHEGAGVVKAIGRKVTLLKM